MGGNVNHYDSNYFLDDLQSFCFWTWLHLLTVTGLTQQTEKIPPQDPAAIPIPNIHWNREEHCPPLKHDISIQSASRRDILLVNILWKTS